MYILLQEEIAKLNRKLERSKKIEMAGAADEVLMAEIGEYKVTYRHHHGNKGVQFDQFLGNKHSKLSTFSG